MAGDPPGQHCNAAVLGRGPRRGSKRCHLALGLGLTIALGLGLALALGLDLGLTLALALALSAMHEESD